MNPGLDKLATYFIVKALKNGDLSAYEKIYKAYYSRLFNFARKFQSTSSEPDDFVQQTFMNIWEKKELLDENILLEKQIYVICKNIILNHIKREQKMQSYSNLDDVLPYPGEDQSTLEGSNEEDNWKKNKLASLIDQLPEKRKEVYLLHKLNNLSYEEISESLGISKKTIANHIYLASVFIKERV
ncbi:RNA polymerase sigma factor [Salinimicrobium flavum]|uniref:RNA polymerase sigma factor n=1 Tax=Salinimicrobium flavum TaxID=1737065 RepID=A0ABW5ITL4_9FLAO